MSPLANFRYQIVELASCPTPCGTLSPSYTHSHSNFATDRNISRASAYTLTTSAYILKPASQAP